MKKEYQRYLNYNKQFDKITLLEIISLLIVIAGNFGFLYEFIFYYFNGGMKQFYMQGGNFLPWINIYAIGAVMIYFLTYKFRKKPWLVFLISFVSCGVLEYISGLGIYVLLGKRYWDYNNEILNFGNIDGFICLRSLLFFGISSLFLMYIVIPFTFKIAKSVDKRFFAWVCLVLLIIVLFDEVYNLVFSHVFDLPNAVDVYKKIGLKYVTYN